MRKERMKSLVIISGVLAVLGLTAAMILSPLHLFNSVVPFDSGASRVASGIAYGAGPRRMLDVYRPSTSEQNLPVIVFSYGGAWDPSRRLYTSPLSDQQHRLPLRPYDPHLQQCDQ